MRRETFKNLLAAVGAVFLVLMVLSLIIAYLSGKGPIGGKNKVAVVKLAGIITDPTDFTDELREYGERDDVKAVVVRIDSPGGAVGPSQEIYSAIKRLRKTKKVVASMGAMAASGGFYAATAADKIVANPGTITGSIGVIVEFVNAEELLSKIGLQGYVVKSGKFKDTGSPLRKMTPEEKELLQDVINDVNGQFVKAVAEGRGLKEEDVRKIADGRIFSGAQAREKGLVDRLGDLSDAIDLSAELAGIEGKPYVIYPEKKALGIWRAVFGESIGNLAGAFSGFRVMYMTQNPAR
ncbi:MAG: signal peptide peptidase SppA [Deltaproteobacteria bacterium]|nr:signal peptide peptidase SppA [Deltaproteobacteria bacterium]